MSHAVKVKNTGRIIFALEGYGNEADFLGFLQNICGDIRNRRVGESTRMPIDTIFFIPLNKSMVLVHYIPGFFFVKLIF